MDEMTQGENMILAVTLVVTVIIILVIMIVVDVREWLGKRKRHFSK